MTPIESNTNRIIKFRAWSKVSDKYYYWDAIRNWDFDTATWDEYQFEQFTGLLDKNGKEIYEGDVMDYGHGRTFYISYSGTQFAATFKDAGINVIIPINAFEIIGNIHTQKHTTP